MKEGIDLAIDGAVAVITINRPGARNALDQQAADDLAIAAEKIAGDDAIGAAVIHGAGGTFCAGADLREMADTDAAYRPWAGAGGPLAKPLAKPLIAAVEGHAVAGGLGVALWADLRVASETAVFGVFCRRFGVPMSDGTPTRLPGVIGRARALDMLLTGRRGAVQGRRRTGRVFREERFMTGEPDRPTDRKYHPYPVAMEPGRTGGPGSDRQLLRKKSAASRSVILTPITSAI